MTALLYALADTVPLWRPSVIALLALVVIGCISVAVSVYDA